MEGNNEFLDSKVLANYESRGIQFENNGEKGFALLPAAFRTAGFFYSLFIPGIHGFQAAMGKLSLSPLSPEVFPLVFLPGPIVVGGGSLLDAPKKEAGLLAAISLAIEGVSYGVGYGIGSLAEYYS